jgi:glycosyltransferase involved in cell wall biosynthesis
VVDFAPDRATPLLVFADDWGRHPSSSQHLIRRLRDEFPVLWVNSVGTRRVRADSVSLKRGLEKLGNWRRGLTKVSERMWVVDPPMIPGHGSRHVRGLNRCLLAWRLRGVLRRLGLESPLLVTNLPYINGLVRDLRLRGRVYYCTDDYSHWPSADGDALRRADREFAAEADLVLAVSRALHARYEATGRCHYFPHGVDYAHFRTARDARLVAADVARLPGPRVGFFGLIYEKLDFELLGALARRFPAGSLVMIGSVVHCPEWFARLPNVHLLGPKPYEHLPSYIAPLDVLLLPYLADDPMIRQSGPLKLKECLAAGKPTVSVDVPEVRALEPHVRVASDRGAFLGHVVDALAEPTASPRVDARQRAVEGDDWDRRADLLRSHLYRLAADVTAASP